VEQAGTGPWLGFAPEIPVLAPLPYRFWLANISAMPEPAHFPG
jgi:hypothetical protein